MNNNENNFESLRHLLVLKRHEIPPPGYINNFSSNVIQRIRAGHTGESASLLEQFFGQAPWASRLLQVFNVKPVFAGGFAGALCMLLLFGIVYAERPDFTPQPVLQASVSTTTLASVTPASLSQPAEQIGIVSSTSPVLGLEPAAPTFEQQNPLAHTVGLNSGN